MTIRTGCEGIHRLHDTSSFREGVLGGSRIQFWVQRPIGLASRHGVLIGFLPRVGSREDRPGKLGEAHFVEHMLLAGTERLPTNADIVGPIEALGGRINGHTAAERMWFDIVLPEDQLPLAVSTMREILRAPTFRAEDVERERTAIRHERETRYASGEARIWMEAAPQLFPGDPTFEHSPIGVPEQVEAMTADSLREFYDSLWHAGEIQLAVGGAFSNMPDDKIRQELEAAFGSLPMSYPAHVRKKVFHDFEAESPPPRSALLQGKQYGKEQFMLLYPMLQGSLDDFVVLRFLKSLLAVGRSSPLMKELRERRGYLYAMPGIRLHTYADVWVLAVSFPARFQAFTAIRNRWRQVLLSITDEQICAALRARQMTRHGAYSDPLEVCASVLPEQVAWNGRPLSFGNIERAEDDIRYEQVRKWLTHLVEKEAYEIMVCH